MDFGVCEQNRATRNTNCRTAGSTHNVPQNHSEWTDANSFPLLWLSEHITAHFLQWDMNHGLAYFHRDHVLKWPTFHFRFEMSRFEKGGTNIWNKDEMLLVTKKSYQYQRNDITKALQGAVWKSRTRFSLWIETSMESHKWFPGSGSQLWSLSLWRTTAVKIRRNVFKLTFSRVDHQT
jgi:hypothetical protein